MTATTERNRATVQAGLDRRAADAKDAAQDAITRDFLAHLNRETEARQNAKHAAKTVQRRKKARNAIKNRRYANQHIFLRRTYRSLPIPIIVAILYLFGVIPLIPTVSLWIGTALFLIYNAIAYITRNRKK